MMVLGGSHPKLSPVPGALEQASYTIRHEFQKLETQRSGGVSLQAEITVVARIKTGLMRLPTKKVKPPHAGSVHSRFHCHPDFSSKPQKP